VAALCVLLTPLMLGAASPGGVRPALCIPILWWPKPTPTPSPSPSPTLNVPGVPLPTTPAPGTPTPDEPTPGAPDAAQPDNAAPDATPTPAPAVPDESAPTFTGTPAQMSSKGLSFTGLKGISLVAVPTIDSAIEIPTDIRFGPGDVARITVRNDDSVANRAGPWVIGPGQTYTARFDNPGVYEFECTVDASESVTVTVTGEDEEG